MIIFDNDDELLQKHCDFNFNEIGFQMCSKLGDR